MTTRTSVGLGAMLAVVLAGISPVLAQGENNPFRSMAVDEGNGPLCEVPKIPVEFARTGGETDAYTYWVEKLELERRLESGECDCQMGEITWEEVERFAEPWLTVYLDDPVIERREITSQIEALRLAVSSACAS